MVAIRGVQGDGVEALQAGGVGSGQGFDGGGAARIDQVVLGDIHIGANRQIEAGRPRGQNQARAPRPNLHSQDPPAFLNDFILWTGSIPFAIVRRNVWSIATGISS